jgi:serine/threonine protein kinase
MIGQTLFDRYEIKEVIGSGGFSAVYKAFDKWLERPVAIKVIPASRRTAVTALKEARTVSLLSHPNIVTLYEFIETETSYYLIMELLRGLSLAEVLKIYQLSIQEAAAIAYQICLALEEAHRNGIVHRDIKPANIMILPDGRVKVMDFGLARLQRFQEKRDKKITGTPGYLAPEQLRREYIDEKVDIFALGVVFYEMLTGKHPFAADTEQTIIFKTLHTEPPPPSELKSDLPSSLDNLTLRALAKNPEDRFASVTDLKYKLKHAGIKEITEPTVLAGLAKNLSELLEEKTAVSRVERFLRKITAYKVFFINFSLASILSTSAYLLFPAIKIKLLALGIIFISALFSDKVGLAIFLALAVLFSSSFSLTSAIFLAIISTIYWLATKQEREAILPLLSFPLTAINLALLQPFIFGLLTRPVKAAIFSSLAALLTSSYFLFSKNISSFFLARNLSLAPELKGDINLWIPPYLYFKTFFLQPEFFFSLVIWSITALTIALLSHRVSKPVVGAVSGFVFMVLAYLSFYQGKPSPVLMQSLSFSFIIALLLALIRTKFLTITSKKNEFT